MANHLMALPHNGNQSNGRASNNLHRSITNQSEIPSNNSVFQAVPPPSNTKVRLPQRLIYYLQNPTEIEKNPLYVQLKVNTPVKRESILNGTSTTISKKQLAKIKDFNTKTREFTLEAEHSKKIKRVLYTHLVNKSGKLQLITCMVNGNKKTFKPIQNGGYNFTLRSHRVKKSRRNTKRHRK